MSNLTLENCAFISLQEYERLKEIEKDSREIINAKLRYMLSLPTFKKGNLLKYKGVGITKNDSYYEVKIPLSLIDDEDET